ncbi:MAG TPA: ABC transporter substrate-binding protein [Aggregatilinea sp.]|uniref:ABC transporter substrate-binding protein n=1 Tax=Aggregatilinea sp. TaxID=2806333 RepID=UPI002BAA6E07|nr:ABC transporter substrate-binding protein [Aggregatilinea sp.]HML20282.1 ABC transporter substrate-binding protein [Aggregatilinea sp.]
MMKRLIAIFLVLAVAIPTFSVTSAQGDEQVLYIGLDVGPGGYNNSMPYNYGAGHTMHSKMYTPLFIWNADSTDIVPFIVESYESNDDFTVWTFKLREDVYFSDGEQLTASDVKFTADFMTSSDINLENFNHINEAFGQIEGFEAHRNGEAEELSGVQVVDDFTFQYTLSSSNPRIYGRMYGTYIFPQHAIDFAPADYQTTDWWYNADKQVGSGPWVVADYKRDEYIELAPNEYYFQGKPKLDRLVNRYFPDETAAVLALAAGEIDFSYVSPDVLPTLDPDTFEIYGGNSYVSIFFHINYNNSPEEWQDLRVRQAFMYAIDRQAIADVVLEGTHMVLPCLVPIESVYTDNLNDYAYDPDKAKALLAEAGVDPADLGTIDWVTHPGYANPLMKDAVQASQAYLADIGIQAEMRYLDLPTWRTTYLAEGYQMGFRGQAYAIFSPPLAALYTNAGAQGGDINGWDYAATGFEDVVNQALTAPTFEEYTAKLGELCQMENDQLPWLPMWVGERYGALNQRVKDFYWYPAGGGGPYDDHSELWYIED